MFSIAQASGFVHERNAEEFIKKNSKALDSGCKSCHAPYVAEKETAGHLDLQAEFEYITGMEKIMESDPSAQVLYKPAMARTRRLLEIYGG